MSCQLRHIVAIAVLAAAAVGCSHGDATAPPPAPPPVVVEILTITHEEIEDVVDLVGQLEAQESVLLKPETSGIIESVEFEEGQVVKKGMLLFRLRDDWQKARLREAEARLALTEEDYARSKTLAGKGTMSQAELDRDTAEWQSARARLDVARVELQRTEIRAPLDGILGARFVSPGDRVETDTGLVQIDAIDHLRLLFTVPEIAVSLIRVGMPVNVSVAPWPDERFPGEVYFVAPALDPANRRLLLKAWVANPAHKLRPGMFATISAEVARRHEALVVPESAIAYDTQGAYVWRVSPDDTAVRARVVIGVRRAGRVEITEGLQVNDRIVSAGTHKVVAGAHLQAAAPMATKEPG